MNLVHGMRKFNVPSVDFAKKGNRNYSVGENLLKRISITVKPTHNRLEMIKINAKEHEPITEAYPLGEDVYISR